MNNYLKFGILFILCAVVLTTFSIYLNSIFDLFGASLNYITTGSVGMVLAEIIGFCGWFLDLLFINQSISYTTHFGNIAIGSIAWALTFVRVIFGVVVSVLILKLIFDR